MSTGVQAYRTSGEGPTPPISPSSRSLGSLAQRASGTLRPSLTDGLPEHQTVDELEQRFGTSATWGLRSAAAAAYLARDGPNELETPPRPTFAVLFLLQMTGFVMALLLGAAVASIVVNATGPNAGDWLSYASGEAIFIIVILNAGIAASTEYKAGGALEALLKLAQPSIYVVRNGQEIRVDVPSVVRGDVVVLSTGDFVPADLRLIESDDIRVNEMALTGEPGDVSKNLKVGKPGGFLGQEKLLPDNMLFSGCCIANGRGKGIVVQTGMDTRIGRIARLIANKDGASEKKRCCGLPDTTASWTPLQKNLDELGARVGMLSICVCVFIFVVGVAMDRRDPSSDDPNNPAWLYMILVAVTLAVAAIPEGIPLCVTIALSIGCNDMVKKHVLVRKLAAVETLGSASVICTDKTGTLTEGKMTMVNMWSADVSYEVGGKGFDPTVGRLRGPNGRDGANDLGARSTLFAALLCCNTTLGQTPDPQTPGKERWEPRGNSSEAPIVVAARKIGFNEETVANECRRVLEVPFSSVRKMMLTVSTVSGRAELCEGGMPLDPGTRMIAVCKGAPNFILSNCTEKLEQDGRASRIEDAERNRIMRVVDGYSNRALRVLAIAAKCLPELPFDARDEGLSTDAKFEACRGGLRLLGLVASSDPERDGVPEAVLDVRSAGIRVVMITGDYLQTAIAIAHNVNILVPGDDEAVMASDCAKLRPEGKYLSHSDMDRLVHDVRVFARAKPEDKLEIVKSLQRQHLVTAMTGDGVNDAPALHQSDIGVAMGIQGTDVAKGASDLILTDDNFCSIAAAVEKGRIIYAGIQKFVAFIMSVHIAEVLQIFLCIIIGLPVMRSPLQILFLILVTDLPACIALALEPGEKTVLTERPRPKEEPVVLDWMWWSMVLNGLVMTAVLMGVYVWALITYCDGYVFQEDIESLDYSAEKLMDARTVAFVSLVLAEGVRAYSSRTFDKPFYHNLLGNVAMQTSLALATFALLVAVLTPFLSTKILALDGMSIGLSGWLMAMFGPVASLVLCEACKLVTIRQMDAYQNRLAEIRLNDDLMRHEQNIAFDRFVSISSSRGGSTGSLRPSIEATELMLMKDGTRRHSKTATAALLGVKASMREPILSVAEANDSQSEVSGHTTSKIASPAC